MASTDVQVYAESAKLLEQERLSLLAQYNPNDHMVSWPAKDAMGRSITVHYYPAAWRLYELSLRYPNANFKTEIISMNEEKDFVIVKAYLFLGTDYASSEKRAEAFKQGKLSQLDRVETKAMARAARNLGVGTERALDMDEAEGEMIAGTATTVTPAGNGNQRHVVEAGNAPRQLPPPQELTLEQLKDLCDELYGAGKWEKVRSRVLPPEEVGDITDDLLSQAQKAKIHAALIQRQKAVKTAATSGK